MNDGTDEETGKGKGKRLSARTSRRHATSEPASTCSSVQDAAVALLDGDAQSLAHFFRGLLPPAAKNGGPQHVCLKHAFALMDRRWQVDGTFPAATADGTEPPLVFGRKKSLLSPELFANVVGFLDQNHALRTTSTCKAWWRIVSSLPLAAHLNLCTLRLRRASFMGPPGPRMGWQDLLNHIRHITSRNPHRIVRRLTLNGSVKLGSMSNLSSAAAGLLTHIDFSRARSSRLSFQQLGVGMPGLKGLGVQESLCSTDSREWVKSLAKLTSVVSLESLRVYATQYHAVSDAEDNTRETIYRCSLDDSFFVSLASSGESLRKLWLVSGCPYGADVEDGMAALGAAVPRLEVLTTDMLRVTDRGWAAFAAARLASKRYLVSIRIKAPGATHMPSEATRALLMDAVTESLLLSDSSWDVYNKLPSPPTTVVDCEGRDVASGRDGGSGLSSKKLRVTFDGPWKTNYESNAEDV